MSTGTEQQLSLMLDAVEAQTRACAALTEAVSDDMVDLLQHLRDHELILVNKSSKFELMDLQTSVSLALDGKANLAWTIAELLKKVDKATYIFDKAAIIDAIDTKANLIETDAKLATKADSEITTAALTAKAGTQWVLDLLRDTASQSIVNALLLNKADLIEGKIPSYQLPGYVDSVLEFDRVGLFPTTGIVGKIYIALDTNITYRWGSTVYVPVGSDLALGETDRSAYRGDRGKEAYVHAISPHCPPDAEKNVQSDWDAVSGDAFIMNRPATFPATAHTHSTSEVGLSNIPNAISDSVTLASSSTIASSKAVKTAYDMAVSSGTVAESKSDAAHVHDTIYPRFATTQTITGVWTFTKIISAPDVNTTSDRRLKMNLEEITADDKLSFLKGYTFEFINNPGNRVGGLMAQDVQKVLPESVKEDENGNLSISYSGVTALLVESQKASNERIATLEAELSLMKNDMLDLQELLSELLKSNNK